MRPAKSTSSSLISHRPSHPSHLAPLLPSRLRRHASGRQGRAGRRVTHCRRARAGRSGRERARAGASGSLEPARRVRPPSDLVFCRAGSAPPPKARWQAGDAGRRTRRSCVRRSGWAVRGRRRVQSAVPPPPPPQHDGRAGRDGRGRCRVTEGRTGRGGGYGLQIADGGGLRAGTQLCNDNGTAH